jgi:hypothetical protein
MADRGVGNQQSALHATVSALARSIATHRCVPNKSTPPDSAMTVEAPDQT